MKSPIFWVLLLIITASPQCSFAQITDLQNRDYSLPDALAAKVKKTNDLDKLSEALTSNFTDTIDKYRAIFTWIALNIDYDCYAYSHPNKIITDPAQAISRGKAVCAGYSSIFQSLCKKAGLEIKTINGWAKNSPACIGQEFEKKTDHAWNAIKIKGIWYNCDVTWAAGSVTPDNSKFIKEFKDYLFCTPPEYFYLNHYPEDSIWFLGFKISKEKFQSLPHFYPRFFEKKISNLSPEKGVIKFKKGKKIIFTFYCAKPIQYIQVMTSSEKSSFPVDYSNKNNLISFEYEMRRISNYLDIYIDKESAITYKLKQ
jgi:transglutaminase/protease-like cytokinesis protein 3